MTTFDLAEAQAVLARTPAVLDTWLRGLPAGWVETPEDEGRWSPLVVVGHLVHGERTDWIQRARIILEHGEARPFEPFDRFAQLADPQPLEAWLDTFAELRGENLATLGGWSLGPAELARTGRHPELGVVTLSELLATWVVHDLSHLRQIARAMAKRLRDDVGAWRAYIPALDE